MTTPAGGIGVGNPLGGLPGGSALGVGLGPGGGLGGLGGGAVGLPGGVQLPNAGTGGASPSASISFLVILGAVSAGVGLLATLLGRERERENDGISVVSVPIHWV